VNRIYSTTGMVSLHKLKNDEPQIDRFTNVRGGRSRWSRHETEEKGGNRGLARPRSVRRCRDVEKLCVAFYEFPSVELAFLSDAKEKRDKVKPYSSQVLFKFSSPLSTSCASSLSVHLGAAGSEGKKLREDPQNRVTILFCLPSVRSFSQRTVKVTEPL